MMHISSFLLDDFKIFLPRYLSSETSKTLFENLEQFTRNPEKIQSLMYCPPDYYSHEILQGDGINIYLGESKTPSPVMVLSNSCDVDINNRRYFDSFLLYSPIISLEKYKNKLIKSKQHSELQIRDHIADIKKQHITQIFYLPKGRNLSSEYLIFFDKTNNIRNQEISRDTLQQYKQFTLSQTGFYLFLFKISIHFTRMMEGIDRDNPHTPQKDAQ